MLIRNSLENVAPFALLCSDPTKVTQIVLNPDNCNPDPPYLISSPHWADCAWAEGYPSLVTFYSTLDALLPHENWDQVVHTYVLKIKECLESSGIAQYSSMYGGIAGICFALHLASRQETRYMRLLEKLDSFLIKAIEEELFIPLRENLKRGLPSSPALYELIQGISGVALYALQRKKVSHMHTIVEESIRLLCRLTDPLNIEGHLVPGWYFAHEDQFTQLDKDLYPKGNFNMGLAHGIPGVLGFLAVSKLQGFHIEGQLEAMEKIVLWLQNKQQIIDGFYLWKSHVSFEDEILSSTDTLSSLYNRDGWCYGTPGVARSLYLAGKALKQKKTQDFALNSFCSLLKRPLETWSLPGPSICHGIAGLLLITHWMFKDSNDPFLEDKVKYLESLLLNYYNSSFPFGFCDLDPKQSGGYAELHKTGILEGASGIWLTLLTVQHPTIPWYFPLMVNDV